MGFLRRLLSGSDDAQPHHDSSPPTVVRGSTGGIILAGTACPLCGVDFDPIPVQAGKRRCPACRELVYVARVDDVGYIVRDKASAPAPVASDDESRRAHEATWYGKNGPERSVNRRRLNKWAGLGLWVTIEGEARCRTCRADLGRSYLARSAPLLPRSDCTSSRHDLCFLRYRLTMPPG